MEATPSVVIVSPNPEPNKDVVFGDGARLELSFGCPNPVGETGVVIARVLLTLRDQAKHGLGIEQAYLLDIETIASCLPPTTKDGVLAVYWLLRKKPTDPSKPVPEWSVVMATHDQPTALMMNEHQIIVYQVNCLSCTEPDPVAHLQAFTTQNVPDQFVVQPQNNPIASVSQPRHWNDPDIISPNLTLVRSVPQVFQTMVGQRDLKERQKTQFQELAKLAPQAPQWQCGGMGCSPASVYAQSLQVNEHVQLDVAIVSGDHKHLATVHIEAMVVARHVNSTLTENKGVVYMLDTTSVTGAEDTVFAFAPLRIAGQKLRYWLCVYENGVDTKVIVTLDTVAYDALVSDVDANRLAEYPVTTIKHG